MTDNQTTPGASSVPPESMTTNDEPQDVSQLPAWAQALVKDLRAENAKHRTGKKAAEEAAAKAEEQRLLDEKKWQELAEKRAKELEALKPLADKVTMYEEMLTATLAKRLEAIPKDFKSLVPDFGDPVKTLGWLDANNQLFATRRAPNLDGGAGTGGDSKSAPALTAEELAIAKQAGVSPERWAARKKEIADMKPIRREDLDK